MKKNIYYWSPCLNKVGTVKATINSANSLLRYSRDYNVKIIDVFGEWNEYENEFKNRGIKKINLTFNYYKYLPKTGYVASRISYIIIILISFFPLITLLKKDKPDFLIIHLITSLPLTIFNIFNFKTKLILRISGLPKLDFLRKKLWKFSSKCIFKITSPTEQTLSHLKESKIFNSDKLMSLPDPIIDISEFRKKINDNNFKPEVELNFDYFLSVGRFSKQKNFIYLISEFEKFVLKSKNYKLIIIGDGEEKNKLKKIVKNKGLENSILLLGRTENVFYYMKRANAFILSSLWEDPGFVLIESALSNLFIISSNCPNGPKEILDYGKSGILYESNKKNELASSLEKYFILDDVKVKKVQTKKNAMKYTQFRHFLKLNKFLK